MEKLRRSALTAFRLNGLSLSSDASNYLVQMLSEVPTERQPVILDKILDHIQRQTLTTSLISRDAVGQAMKECGSGTRGAEEEALHIIDAYSIPRLVYDSDRKKFLPDHEPQSILAAATEKPKIFRNRYSVILQRILHHSLFTPNILGVESEEGSRKYNLKTVEFLVGSSSRVGGVIVLGLLTQLKEEKYFLEDLTGFVELDLSETAFCDEFFTENCFVLAEGYYEDSIFHVSSIGPPPPEEAAASRSYYGMTNFFGGPPPSRNRGVFELIEKKQESFAFTIMSDLHLDSPTTLKKLRVLFEGYNNEAAPGLIILMGNFLAEPTGTQKPIALRDAFKNLADVIVEYPRITEHFKFVIVPGPLDPGFVNILPRPPFADVIISYFKEKVPNSVFTSNPCRIKYCTKEIVILRQDIMTKIVRNSLNHPTGVNHADCFVSTLIGQSHLCPLPLHICPVYWSYDHALSLYPLPNLVIIGDKGDPFSIQKYGCHFVNPGSFRNNNYAFKTYTPFRNEIEDCALPDTE